MKKIELIAKLCHEVNRVYCESLGDFSQKSWEETSQNIKDSAIDGVNFSLYNDVSPMESHDNWCEFKIKEGWVYGEEKDLEKKTHPCLMDYEELPEDQKIKDKFFTAIVEVFKNE